ncbi:hypothetical protein GCM10010124_11490 [Pilimelia terevasa]|uniref:Uncharacterized protein n=1 Tax=Pilimelia terevasa TaxID=53372 RepID=A0A8J3BQJ8_9ACTN|nr:hypothetical protein GCM10010124_11490 [Pilimelia terevasa]
MSYLVCRLSAIRQSLRVVITVPPLSPAPPVEPDQVRQRRTPQCPDSAYARAGCAADRPAAAPRDVARGRQSTLKPAPDRQG